MTLFKNRTGSECFVCSLANAIYAFHHDLITAQKVYTKAQDHELVLPKGVTLAPSWPKIVKDLTQDKYKGTLFLTKREYENLFDPMYFINRCVDAGEEFGIVYQRAVKELLKKHSIQTLDMYDNEKPVLLSLKGGEGIGHVVTMDDIVIDDGIIRNNISQSFILTGILHLDRIFRK